MITTISKHFDFEAAHFLPTVPEHHPCSRMHGHSYRCELRFSGKTAPNGFCAGIDYSDIAAVWARLHARVDHRTLNEVPGLEVPSTENLVAWIAREFIAACGGEHRKLADSLSRVSVEESRTTRCEMMVSQAWRTLAMVGAPP